MKTFTERFQNTEGVQMIKAVMFDMGGTIEDLYADEKNEKATALALDRILKSHGLSTKYGAEELWSIVGPRILAYKKQSEKTMIELSSPERFQPKAFAVPKNTRNSSTICGMMWMNSR